MDAPSSMFPHAAALAATAPNAGGGGAAGPAWDRALAGHSAQERAAAEAYTLDM